MSQVREVNVVQANDQTFIVRVLAEGSVASLTTAADFEALVVTLKSAFQFPVMLPAETSGGDAAKLH